jgi:hypothetical protein
MADNRGGREAAASCSPSSTSSIPTDIELARRCAAEVQTAVRSSIERTRLGGNVLASAVRAGCTLTFETLEGQDLPPITDQDAGDRSRGRAHHPRRSPHRGRPACMDMLAVLCRRQAVLRRLREDIRLQGWLNAWLYVHVPITVAALAALLAHIVSTFIYW